ncbi:TPA: hypothetical protein ACXORD_005269 [Bacillus luti]
MIKSGIFNSVNGDRKYDARDFASYFSTFIGNGVFPNPETGFKVVANNTLTVTIKKGDAWINGYIVQNTDDYKLTIALADGVLNRIDRIVLQLNYLNREIVPLVKKGQFASSPVAPSLKRDKDAYEIAIADIYVSKGSFAITDADITDVRLNKNLCGIVHGVVDQVDTTTIFNQYLDWLTRTKQKHEQDTQNIISGFTTFTEAEKQRYKNEFTAWFNNLKVVLDGNVAGNLMNEITKTNERCDNISQTVNTALETLYVSNSGKDIYGVFTTVEWRTKSNVLRRRSVLSDPDSDMNYRIQTVTKYEKDGVTIASTVIYQRLHDDEGDFMKEVPQ